MNRPPIVRTYYHSGFAAPIGPHIMPMKKFSDVANILQTFDFVAIEAPAAIAEEDLLRVHTAAYVEAVKTGVPLNLAESQKFPWSPALFPSVLLTNGGVLAAAKEALRIGYSAALASGFHHAHRIRGEGFCTFNGLIVTLDALRQNGQIARAAVLDMDLHYGNGTALLAAERPWIQALSFYGNDYWDNKAYRDIGIKRHSDGVNHRSVGLPAGCDGPTLYGLMDRHLDDLLDHGRPDLLLYQAGADPYYEDPYSPLALDHQALLERDRRVFSFAKAHKIPVAWVLAGGYTSDLSKVVKVHTNTFMAWKEIYG